MRNTWRIKKKTPQLIQGNKYRGTDLLWWTRQKDVYAEIASIMELPTANSNTPGWFEHRMAASKNILDTMTVEEKTKFEDDAERYRVEGLPKDVQRK